MTPPLDPRLCLTADRSVREAITCIDENRRGIALIVDGDGRLLDTVTDGDIRRAILAGVDLDAPVERLRERRRHSPYPAPVTAPIGTEPAALVRLMQERKLQQIPLLDAEQRVAGLVTLRELLPEELLPLQAVVMAGGYGQRLRPLTDDLPKAMLPIGQRPLLELILQQLQQAGVRQVNLMTHYKAEVIANHFGDGQRFGVGIRYVREDQPLGTAGSLGMLETGDAPLLVMNGDIMTQVDFRAMLDFHREHQADMTVAVRQHEVAVPYGVVELRGVEITGIAEKPTIRRFIIAGIYLLGPGVCRTIPRGQRYDMTDLIARLVREGRRVVSFPIREYWVDIGHAENYQKVLADAAGRAA
jgi:dTDP-glucose pyrophosphorylase/CBS domain-containing protein